VPILRRAIWGVIGLLLAVALGAGLWRPLESRSATAPVECPVRHAVVLDPGHGGIDGGTNWNGVLEKEIVLDIALRTEAYLTRQKVPVLLTRSSDRDLGGPNDNQRLRRDINYRIRLANQCQAAFLLSIHVNSATNPRERGMMLFYQPSPVGRDAAFLLDDILRRWPLHARRERPHPRPDFAVLRWTRAPAVLVELGFLTDPTDRKRLQDSAYREQVAQALAAGAAALYQQWIKEGSD